MNTQNYFAACFDEAAIKTRFRELAKANHPDLGGSLEEMQRINAAYSAALRGEYRKTMTDNDAETAVEMDEEIAAKVSEIIALQGIIIEIVGKWLWVTGDTFTVKDALKAAAFKFAAKKRAWFFRREQDAARFSKGQDLDTIKAKYGCRVLTDASQGSFRIA